MFARCGKGLFSSMYTFLMRGFTASHSSLRIGRFSLDLDESSDNKSIWGTDWNATNCPIDTVSSSKDVMVGKAVVAAAVAATKGGPEKFI